MIRSQLTKQLAQDIRATAIQIVANAKASHIGGALSMADLLAVLYGDVMRVRPEEPKWLGRDRFVLSKGHCCAGLYAVLALQGFIPLEELATYGRDGSRLMAHAYHKVPGVEFSTGSLGHGLPYGVGQALAGKLLKSEWNVFVMLSDGELDEGSNWESVLFAPQHKLDNLVAIVDYNKIQSLGRVADVIDLAPLKEKFEAFRWSVKEVDGHDHDQILAALGTLPWERGKPNCLIAHTTKGKGVDFMEDSLRWHYSSPDNSQLKAALSQIGVRS